MSSNTCNLYDDVAKLLNVVSGAGDIYLHKAYHLGELFQTPEQAEYQFLSLFHGSVVGLVQGAGVVLVQQTVTLTIEDEVLVHSHL